MKENERCLIYWSRTAVTGRRGHDVTRSKDPGHPGTLGTPYRVVSRLVPKEGPRHRGTMSPNVPNVPTSPSLARPAKKRKSLLTRPARIAGKKSVGFGHGPAVGFCPLEAMFSLRFLALSKIGYQVIGRYNAIDAIDKSDWPALSCPIHVLAAQ
jgi:hypothetical protein